MTDTLTIIIFALTYIMIAVQKIPVIRIDRPSGVLVGSTLLLIIGAVTLPEAYKFIDWDVITFLTGMMIITSYLEYAGFFPLAAGFIVKTAKTGRQLLLLVVTSTALLSALFVNDTVCLLFAPVILTAAKRLKVNPVPFLLAVAFSSNVGSALTVTGNPQNMYIGIVSGMPFLKFTLYTFLPVAAGLLTVYAVLCLMYKKDLGPLCCEITPEEGLYDKALIIKSLLALGVTLALFLFHVSYPLAALIGATLIILTGRVTPKAAFVRVDWQLLIFFAGLFVVMGAIEKTHFMTELLNRAALLTQGSDLRAVSVVGAVTLALSNIVSNVPAVIMVYPVIAELPEKYPAYLALISTFAGNLTIVGSVANLIVVERARMQGVEISFMAYFRAGVVVTLCSALFAAAFILII